MISCLISGGALLACLGVFLYGQYLQSVEKAKQAQLTTAENTITESTVDQFLRLRDRLVQSETILNNHVELSQFLTELEGITLQNVDFNSLTIQVAPDRTATLNMAGKAQDFNALAVESQEFASTTNIQSAIFSGISLNKDNTVNFTISASLNPSIIVEASAPTTQSTLPAASSTAPSFPSETAPSTASVSSTTP